MALFIVLTVSLEIIISNARGYFQIFHLGLQWSNIAQSII